MTLNFIMNYEREQDSYYITQANRRSAFGHFGAAGDEWSGLEQHNNR
jgi:hypothetical protein